MYYFIFVYFELPCSGNKSARSKFDAWNACRGLSKLNAMEKYIALLKKMDPNFDGDEANVVRNSEVIVEATTQARIIIEGTLFKQQDVFKGWSPRYFVLDEWYQLIL